MPPMLISHTVKFVHSVLQNTVRPGDIAIDATMGNGHDTLFLANLVGETGHVHAFDILEQALEKTSARLQDAGVSHAVLHHAGHETMRDHLPVESHGQVAAAMFNLGYLPGSDKTTITCGETSCRAMDAAFSLLRPGGIISMVLYVGHEGGPEEAQAVEDHAASLSRDEARVMRCTMHNDSFAKIRVLFIEKR